MRFKRIMLITPPYRGSRVKSIFCAGLGYIAEILKYSGFEYTAVDMSLGCGYRYLKKRIEDFKPDLIGISMMTYRYKDTYHLIKSIKEDYPQITVVAGGPHISLFREKVLSDCPQIDYGVVLEGEETIRELCRGVAVDSINGLIYKNDDSLIYNGDRPFIKNLDEIPFPRYENFELEKSINRKNNALPIVSSRGCPFDCIYCPVQCAIGQIFRARSPESIVDELRYWYKNGYRRFSFADDNFTLLKDRVYQLCHLIKANGLSNLKLSCDNGIRADKVDKDLLKVMKEAGFFRLAIGVEAGNNKVLRILKKKEDIETIKRTINDARDLGFEVDLFFLVGSPGETRQDLEDSFKIALGHPLGTAFFYNIVPFPTTELFDWIQKRGRFLEQPSEYLDYFPILDNRPLFETEEMPKKERKKALSAAFKIMRKTMYFAWARRLKRLGVIGKMLAFFYTRGFIQNVVLRHKFFNRLIYKTANFIIRD